MIEESWVNLGPAAVPVEEQTALCLFPTWAKHTYTHTHIRGGTPLEIGADNST